MKTKITFIFSFLIIFITGNCGSGKVGNNSPDSDQNNVEISVPDIFKSEQEIAKESEEGFDENELIGDLSDSETVSCDEIPFPEGCPCLKHTDCMSFACVESKTGNICTSLCADMQKCPEGTGCRLISIGTDMIYACIPEFVRLCQPCYSSNECMPEGICVNYGDSGSFCGAECSEKSPCPDEYDCAEIKLPDESVANQCRLKNGECKCTENIRKTNARSVIFLKTNSHGHRKQTTRPAMLTAAGARRMIPARKGNALPGCRLTAHILMSSAARECA
jgi:hypothetical protein